MGVANSQLIAEAIKERHGDNRVDKLEYTRIVPVVIRYLEDKEGSSGYSFRTGIEFWSERSGDACYYATVAKMNSSGVPIRIYSVLIDCDGKVKSHELVL